MGVSYVPLLWRGMTYTMYAYMYIHVFRSIKNEKFAICILNTFLNHENVPDCDLLKNEWKKEAFYDLQSWIRIMGPYIWRNCIMRYTWTPMYIYT